MASGLEFARAVQFVLVAVFEPLEESVAHGNFKREPRIARRVARTPAGGDVQIAIVRSHLSERIEARPQVVGGRQIHGVVAFADVEGAPICFNAAEHGRDQDVGVRIAVAVRIGGQIVGIEKAADLHELADRFAVVAGHAGGKVLRRLGPARGGLDGEARDRDGSARPARIGIQRAVVVNDLRGRIRRQDRGRLPQHSDRLLLGNQTPEPQVDLCRQPGSHYCSGSNRRELRGAGVDGVPPAADRGTSEGSLSVCLCFAGVPAPLIRDFDLRAGNGRPLGIADSARDAARLLCRYAPTHYNQRQAQEHQCAEHPVEIDVEPGLEKRGFRRAWPQTRRHGERFGPAKLRAPHFWRANLTSTQGCWHRREKRIRPITRVLHKRKFPWKYVRLLPLDCSRSSGQTRFVQVAFHDFFETGPWKPDG